MCAPGADAAALLAAIHAGARPSAAALDAELCGAARPRSQVREAVAAALDWARDPHEGEHAVNALASGAPRPS